MPQIRVTPVLSMVCALILSTLAATAQSGQENLGYILKRYSEANGGRAAMEKISSVRLRGKMIHPSGAENSITVLKKKPNLVRTTLDTGTVRIVQAYNGQLAWYSRDQGSRSMTRKLEDSEAVDLIRDAPLENVLLNNAQNQAALSLGPIRAFESRPCFQIIATYPDGSRIHHFIDQEDFLERRILQFDTNGNETAEIIPSEFEKTDGIVFSMKIERRVDGELRGTLVLEEVETNIGIIDGAFDPPVDLESN